MHKVFVVCKLLNPGDFSSAVPVVTGTREQCESHLAKRLREVRNGKLDMMAGVEHEGEVILCHPVTFMLRGNA